jgi:thiol:disulfide interchange protein
MKTFLYSSLALVALLVAYTTAATNKTDFPEGSPAFKTSLKSALAEAKKENKPVIAIYSASWCGPCQEMKHKVYPSAAVKAFHDKFVWAYLDADDEAANGADMKKFGVEGIPHIQFLSSAGKPIDKQIGSSSPGEFVQKLEGVLKKAGGTKTASN